MFLLFRKPFWPYKTSKISFSRIIFTIYDLEIGGGYKGLQGLHGVTWGYRGLQGVTGDYKGLQGVTGGDKTLQWVKKDYRNFSLTRTFPDTFSWSILHENRT